MCSQKIAYALQQLVTAHRSAFEAFLLSNNRQIQTPLRINPTSRSIKFKVWHRLQCKTLEYSTNFQTDLIMFSSCKLTCVKTLMSSAINAENLLTLSGSRSFFVFENFEFAFLFRDFFKKLLWTFYTFYSFVHFSKICCCTEFYGYPTTFTTLKSSKNALK